MRPLPDLNRRAVTVAPELLGCVLRANGVGVRIVEVEAYEGLDDPASHAYRGPTRRNATMFGPAGFLYVYQMHGHACCNIVCAAEGTASGVLIRAGEVVEGLELARSRRPGAPDVRLARGPGNLTRSLGITTADDGAYLLGSGSIQLHPGPPPTSIVTGARVNISQAAHHPWRFSDGGSRAVSAFKRHPAARETPAVD